jgi:AcrR family transcriptional regulator
MAASRQRVRKEVKPETPRPNGHHPEDDLVSLGRQHHIEHEHVADIQRARMLGAMVQEVSERGVANVAVAHVVGRSGVSRRTFYEIFEDREDCFLAAFDEALERLAAIVVPAYEQANTWRSKVRTALIAFLEALASDPAMGRLLIVESLAAGPVAHQRRQKAILQIIAIVDCGRGANKTGGDPPPLTAEGIIGGVLSVLHTRLAEEHPGDLLDLIGPLMGMIVLPYLGPAAARRELERPSPKRPTKAPLTHRDPLRDLEMRLTYRTVRTLMAVAEQPGSSNRAVGARAGIPDQGQISKLLARLHNLGLIENTATASARGEPNAWTLTTRGWEIHGAIAGQTARA